MRVHIGGGSDVGAFGVENNGNCGIILLEITHGHQQIFIGGLPGIIGDLRFIAADEVRRGVDQRFVEFEDRVFFCTHRFRKFLEIGVESHANERF